MPQKPLSLKRPPSPVRKQRGTRTCRNDDQPVADLDATDAQRKLCRACFTALAASFGGARA